MEIPHASSGHNFAAVNHKTISKLHQGRHIQTQRCQDAKTQRNFCPPSLRLRVLVPLRLGVKNDAGVVTAKHAKGTNQNFSFAWFAWFAVHNLKWTSGGGGRKAGRVTGISGGEMRETGSELQESVEGKFSSPVRGEIFVASEDEIISKLRRSGIFWFNVRPMSLLRGLRFYLGAGATKMPRLRR